MKKIAVTTTINHWQSVQVEARNIRTLVFIQEQQVPRHLEWDGEDEHYLHVIARDAQQIAIGTARFNEQGHIGRMAVLQTQRGQGVGTSIMQAILTHAVQHQFVTLTLNAQVTAIPFYERFGFIATGAVFVDAGIDHRSMEKTLERG